MLGFEKRKIARAVQYFNVIFIASFMLWSMSLPVAEELYKSLLQLLLIMLLFFWRRRRPEALFFIPDEFLFCLPLLWGLANAGSASAWFSHWKWPYVLSFSLSLFWFIFQSENFSERIRNNRLYHAAIAFALFVAGFLMFQGAFFPEFAETLAVPTFLNLAVLFMSFPISAAGFNAVTVESEPATYQN